MRSRSCWLRYRSIVHSGRRRIALEDLEVGGQRICKGDGLIAADNVANRDPSQFPEPDRLDVTHERATTSRSATAGTSVSARRSRGSSCRWSTARSTERIPTLQLAVPPDEIKFKHDMVVYGGA